MRRRRSNRSFGQRSSITGFSRPRPCFHRLSISGAPPVTQEPSRRSWPGSRPRISPRPRAGRSRRRTPSRSRATSARRSGSNLSMDSGKHGNLGGYRRDPDNSCSLSTRRAHLGTPEGHRALAEPRGRRMFLAVRRRLRAGVRRRPRLARPVARAARHPALPVALRGGPNPRLYRRHRAGAALAAPR